MPLDAVSNFVRGETDSSINSTNTTLSVVDASIFPDPSTEGEYNTVIWDVANNPRPDQDPNVEVLRVTAIDTTNNDLTVTRGQEATTGASHPSGSAVHLSPTAKMFGDIESTFNAFYDDTNDVLTSQVGTASTPVSDLYGDSVDANSVSTDDLGITNVGGRGVKSSDQSIPNSTRTQVVIDGSDFEDDSSLIEVDTSNDKLIIKQTGIYILQVSVSWNDNLGDSIYFLTELEQDGTVKSKHQQQTGGNQNPANSTSAIVRVTNPNSDITASVRQDSGPSKKLDDTGTSISVAKLG